MTSFVTPLGRVRCRQAGFSTQCLGRSTDGAGVGVYLFEKKTKPAAVNPSVYPVLNCSSHSSPLFGFIFLIPKEIVLLWLIQSTVFFKVDACDGCKWISVSVSSNGERRQRCIVRISQVGIAGSKFFCTYGHG